MSLSVTMASARQWLALLFQVLRWIYWLLCSILFLLHWVWHSSIWRFLFFCYHTLSQNPLWYPLRITHVLRGMPPLRRNLEKVFRIAAINLAIALLFALLFQIALFGAEQNWCALFFTLLYYCLRLIDVGRSIYAALLYMLYAKILHHDAAVSLPNFVQDTSIRSYPSLRDAPAILCVLREVSSAMFYVTGSLVAYFIGIHISQVASFIFGAYLIGHAAVDYKLSHAMISTQGTLDIAASQHLYYLGLGLPVKAVALLESMLWNYLFGVNESFLEGPLILLLLVVIHAHDLPIVDEYPSLVLHLVPAMPKNPTGDGMYCEYKGMEKEHPNGFISVGQEVFKVQLSYGGKWVVTDLIERVPSVGFQKFRVVHSQNVTCNSLSLHLSQEDSHIIWKWIKSCKETQAIASSVVDTTTPCVSVGSDIAAAATKLPPLPPPAPRSLIVHKRDAKAAKKINAVIIQQFNFAGIKYYRAPRMPVPISPRLQRLAHWLLRRTFETIVTLIKSAATQAEIDNDDNQVIVNDEAPQDQQHSEKHFPLMQWLEAFPSTWYGLTLKRVLMHFHSLDCGQQLVLQRSQDLKALATMLTAWRGEMVGVLQALAVTAQVQSQAEQYLKPLNQIANVLTSFYLTVAETPLNEISTAVRNNVIDSIVSYSGLNIVVVDSVLTKVIKLTPVLSILHQAQASAETFQSMFFLSPGEACQLILAAAKISYKLNLEEVIERLIPPSEREKLCEKAAQEAREIDSTSTSRDKLDTGSSSLDLLSTVVTADGEANSDPAEIPSVVGAAVVESTIQVSQMINYTSLRLRTWTKNLY